MDRLIHYITCQNPMVFSLVLYFSKPQCSLLYSSCDTRRVAVTRHRMICTVLSSNKHELIVDKEGSMVYIIQWPHFQAIYIIVHRQSDNDNQLFIRLILSFCASLICFIFNFKIDAYCLRYRASTFRLVRSLFLLTCFKINIVKYGSKCSYMS